MSQHPPQRSFSFSNNDDDVFHRHQPQTSNPPAYGSALFGQAEPPRPPTHRHPAAHPSSNYSQFQQHRQGWQPAPPPNVAYPPSPPRYLAPPESRPASSTTPCADNLSERSAGGGIAGIAIGVANSNERDSGLQALRAIDNWGRTGNGVSGGPSHTMDHYGGEEYTHPQARYTPQHNQYPSQSSMRPLAASAAAPAYDGHSGYSDRSFPSEAGQHHSHNAQGYDGSYYDNDPYNRLSSTQYHNAQAMGAINPQDIDDDGDDLGMPLEQNPQARRSWMNLGSHNSGSDDHNSAIPAAGAIGGAGAAAAATGLGRRDASGNYNAVPGSNNGYPQAEKSEWLSKQSSGNKRLKWIVGAIIVLLILGGIAGGVAGGILASRKNSSASSGSSAADDDSTGDLDVNSAEIKKLMNNQNLHKVFPGMDYTPLNAQYPGCLTNKPSQNNVTRDMAVLSQLTNAVRLYGTDCNQTEMVLHAIDKLQLKDMKVWMGVWLSTNVTTNTRQLNQMYDIFKASGGDPFAGVIVGNEILYRKDMTVTELSNNLTEVKTNLTNMKIDLPVATSDLGSSWSTNPSLADAVDIVMSNIHPFFGGVPVAQAAGWTWDFWQNNDVPVTKGTTKKQIISEVGWPSAGGNDCGDSVKCTDTTSGAVASVDNMNSFMADFVCQSITNGTDYFWFEAFDEPWKIMYDTPGQEWEDKWGLMDVNRNLKDGLKVPDCGGATAR